MLLGACAHTPTVPLKLTSVRIETTPRKIRDLLIITLLYPATHVDFTESAWDKHRKKKVLAIVLFISPRRHEGHRGKRQEGSVISLCSPCLRGDTILFLNTPSSERQTDMGERAAEL